MRKLIAIVGIVGVPSRYGGFETIVDQLAQRYDGSDRVVVFCSRGAYGVQQGKYERFDRVFLPFKANGLSSVFYDIFSMFYGLIFLRASTILVLGVSGALAIPFLKIIWPRRKFVVNIDGLEWARGKWGKIARTFLKVSEAAACRWSDVVISDNPAISSYVKGKYDRVPVLLSCGGEHATKGRFVEAFQGCPDDFFLSICRIEPENNVEMILEAFKKVKKNIVFVGNWSSSKFGRELVERFGCEENIFLVGPFFDPDIVYSLRARCKAYVHGHSAGGTNPSLVEILHMRKVPICFDCEYNRETTFGKAVYFSTELELSGLVWHSDQCVARGKFEDLFDQSIDYYSWDRIAKGYYELF